MGITTRNTFGPGTLGILGIRGYFRPGSIATAALTATDTTIPVEDVSSFSPSGTVRVGSGSNAEDVTISAVGANSITVSALANSHAAGVLVRHTEWTDAGILKDWSPDEDLEEFEFEGARTGLVVVHDKLTIRAELNYTFRSTNVLDTDVQNLHAGAFGAAAVGSGTVVEVSFNTTRGELLFVRENAQSGKDSKILYHPRATIKRDGESGTPGEEEASLDFSATVLADENFVIPDTVDAAEPGAQYGYVWTFPTADLDTNDAAASA